MTGNDQNILIDFNVSFQKTTSWACQSKLQVPLWAALDFFKGMIYNMFFLNETNII